MTSFSAHGQTLVHVSVPEEGQGHGTLRRPVVLEIRSERYLHVFLSCSSVPPCPNRRRMLAALI